MEVTRKFPHTDSSFTLSSREGAVSVVGVQRLSVTWRLTFLYAFPVHLHPCSSTLDRPRRHASPRAICMHVSGAGHVRDRKSICYP